MVNYAFAAALIGAFVLSGCAATQSENASPSPAQQESNVELNQEDLNYYFAYPNRTVKIIELPDRRVAQQGVMSLPRPTYPREMARARKNGLCEVTLDMLATGELANVEAECDNSRFLSSAVRAFKDVTFTPVTVDGTPVDVKGVKYPLEYTINN